MIDTFPEFDVIFKGSDAIERRGAFYAISDLDHPITKLLQSPKKVPRGTSVLLGLNIYKVKLKGTLQKRYPWERWQELREHLHI